MIEVSALPMPLLSHHCVQFLLMLAKSTPTSTQTVAVKFQFAGAQQKTEHINALFQITNGHGEAQAKQI